MPTINQLSSINTLTTSDQLVVYQTSSGDARKASLGTFLDWFEGAFASPEYMPQYAAPTLSGFVVQLAQSTGSIWLILQPVGVMAAGTVVFPAPSASWDGQEILITTSSDIQSLTLNGNGGIISGSPGYLPANGACKLRYNHLQNTWWVIQSSVVSSPAYYATNVAWNCVDATVTGSVTVSGRWTQVGRMVTLEALIEVSSNPGDQLVWTYNTTALECASTPPPMPWGGYALALVAGGKTTNIMASVAIDSNTGLLTILFDEPNGAATVTFGAGKKLHIIANYTST